MSQIKPFYNFSFWMIFPNFLKENFENDPRIFINNFPFCKDFFNTVFNIEKRNQNISNEKKKFNKSLNFFKKQFGYTILSFYIKNNLKLKVVMSLQNFNIIGMKKLKFLYQYGYKFFSSIYYFSNKYSLSNDFKKRFILFRLINNLSFLYEELEIKNFLRKYYVFLFASFPSILANFNFNKKFNLIFFYKKDYIKN